MIYESLLINFKTRQLTHEVAILARAKNFIDGLLVVIESKVKLILRLHRNVGDVRSLDVRAQVGDTEIFGIAFPARRVWVIQSLNQLTSYQSFHEF